jgi:hypothetical protein
MSGGFDRGTLKLQSFDTATNRFFAPADEVSGKVSAKSRRSRHRPYPDQWARLFKPL